MIRRPFVLLVLTVLVAGFASAGRGRADDDEPSFLNKKLSYWLAQLHEGKDVKARRRGVIAVEQIGHEQSRKVVPALVKAMREDREETIRAAAALAAGRAMTKALEQARMEKKEELPRFDTAREALTTTMRTDKSDTVREAAASALGFLGADARGTAGSLAVVLKDRNPAIVRAAATALRRMGPHARDAQSELQQLAADGKAELDSRLEATVALGQLTADGLPVLKDLLADPKADVRLRRAAAQSLGKLGKEGASASATLAIVLIGKDSPAELRVAVVTALDQFGSEARVAAPALVRAVGDSERVVRILAMHALAQIGKDLDTHRKSAVKAIIQASEDSNVEVCVGAIETLAALSAEGLGGETDDVVTRLKQILRREGRKSIRDAAQAALDRIQPKKPKE